MALLLAPYAAQQAQSGKFVSRNYMQPCLAHYMRQGSSRPASEQAEGLLLEFIVVPEAAVRISPNPRCWFYFAQQSIEEGIAKT